MHITNFESQIEEKILVRGEKYFADGLVESIWSEAPNCYQAVVDGSIPYDVEIHLSASGDILHHSCDCPYDWGEYCKHKAAVLFAIRKYPSKGIAAKQHGKKRGLRASLLEKSKDELVNILCEMAVEHNLSEELYCYLNDCDDRL